jgi:hypothetical protein
VLLDEALESRLIDAKLSTYESVSTEVTEVADIKDSHSCNTFPPFGPILHGLPTISDLPPDMLMENVKSSLSSVFKFGFNFLVELRGRSAPRARSKN